MDFLLCAALAAVESITAKKIWPQNSAWLAEVPIKQFLTLLIVQYFALKYYRISLYHRYVSPLRHIPGPNDNHPFFGQMLKIMKAETPASLPHAWMTRWPDAPFIRYLSFANGETLIPNTTEACKELLQTKCYSLSKPDWFVRSVGQMDGEGIFLMEGAQHRAQRRLLSGPFSRRSIGRLQPVFQSKAVDICATLDSLIASNGGIVDCETVYAQATIEIMSTAVLGIDYAQAQPESTSANVRSRGRRWTFLDAFESFFKPDANGQLLMLINGYVPIRWLPLEANREAASAVAWVHDLLRDMVRRKYAEVRGAMKREEYVAETQRDLITFIVEEDLMDGKANGITEAQFVGHLIQTLGGGYDTTAITLSWVSYVLAKHPGIQDALRKEVCNIPRGLSPTEIDEHRYLDNFLKEVLRVYAPAASIYRKTDTDLIVSSTFIPAGTTIDIRPLVLLMNPRVWGKNAEDVDPTRWNRLEGEQASPFAYSVFSNGPRICVGRQFAMFVLKTVVVELVKNFRFVGVEREIQTDQPGLMYKPTGMRVRVERLT